MNDDDLRLELRALTDSLPPLGGLPLATASRVRRRRAVKLAGAGTAAGLVLLGGFALGAGTGGADRVQPAPLAVTSPSAAPSAAATPAPSPVAPSPTGSAQVALRGDGLGLSAGGDRVLLIESSTAQQVRTALDGALGAGTDQALPDCGPSVVLRSYPGLQVVLQGDRFVGWSTRPGSTLQTVDGIGLGSTLAQLRAAAPSVTVTQTTLGREFSVPGGYFGILTGSGETATVTTIATGNACTFR